ncbi:MAG: hypothetical protein ACREJQ_00705 [bacterium]
METSGTDRKRVLLRKGAHLLGGLPGLLPWSRSIGLIVTAIGTIFNATLLQRFPFFKDVRRGTRDVGYVTYLLALFLAFLLVEPIVARAAWVELAVGDWAAAFFGILIGGPTVPWNRRKHWSGVLAHVGFGLIAVLLFAHYIIHVNWSASSILLVVAACALVETFLSEGWDNLLIVLMFCGLARLLLT